MAASLPKGNPPLLLIVSGPAGSGKTTLCDRLIATHPDVRRAVTCTTRPPRPGEADGVDYYFLTDEAFLAAVDQDEFLEHATVHGRRYGTLRREIREKLSREVSVILNIDIQGAAALRSRAAADPLLQGKVITVFVAPPSQDILRDRMIARGADDPAAIERRVKVAGEEMKQWTEYDYCIRSGARDEDYRRFESILLAERCRTPRLRP